MQDLWIAPSPHQNSRTLQGVQSARMGEEEPELLQELSAAQVHRAELGRAP